MTVTALESRRGAAGASHRAGGATVSVTVDITLAGDERFAETERLLAIVREIVDRAGGNVTVLPPRPRKPAPGPADLLGPHGLAVPAPGGGPRGRAVPPDAVDLSPPAADAVRIDAGTRQVRLGGSEVPLTRLEFDLLLFLAEHRRRVFTREQLLRAVWGYDIASARTVDVHVRRLRAKLGTAASVVTTVYGVGYRLSDEADVRVHGLR